MFDMCLELLFSVLVFNSSMAPSARTVRLGLTERIRVPIKVTDLSRHGSFVFGLEDGIPLVWRETEGTQVLEGIPGGSARVTGASSDGNVFVGFAAAAAAAPHLATWRHRKLSVDLRLDLFSFPIVSDSGTTVLGTCVVHSDAHYTTQGYRILPSGEIQLLKSSDSSRSNCRVDTCSGDGEIAFGSISPAMGLSFDQRVPSNSRPCWWDGRGTCHLLDCAANYMKSATVQVCSRSGWPAFAKCGYTSVICWSNADLRGEMLQLSVKTDMRSNLSATADKFRPLIWRLIRPDGGTLKEFLVSAGERDLGDGGNYRYLSSSDDGSTILYSYQNKDESPSYWLFKKIE